MYIPQVAMGYWVSLAVAEEGPGIGRLVAAAAELPLSVHIVAQLTPDIVVRQSVVAAAGPGKMGVHVVAAR